MRREVTEQYIQLPIKRPLFKCPPLNNKLPVTRVSADAIISKSITVKRTSIKQPRFLPPKNLQVSVIQRLDSAIHRINHYPVDSAISFPNTYPLDSNFPVDSAIQCLNNRGQMT